MDYNSNFKIIVYKSILDLADNLDHLLKNQLNKLVQTSFPLELTLSSSFVDNMKQSVQKGHVENHSVITILCTTRSNTHIIGCVQLLKRSDTFKVINLCRLKGDTLKGLGRYLLKCATLHVKRIAPQTSKIYLSVATNNTKLQEYYQTLGWIKTHEYDYDSDNEPAFKMVYIL